MNFYPNLNKKQSNFHPMGATKKEQFTQEQIHMATLGRAIASPARIAILQHLKSNHIASNKELSSVLQLSRTSVYQHLKILHDAKLVDENYFCNDHGYFLNENAKREMEKIEWVFCA